MGQKEPPSSYSQLASSLFMIGKDSHGHWVVQDQMGLHGGLFVNRAQAVKYALFENGHHPETIVELSREFELDMNSSSAAVPSQATATRRVA